MAESRNKLVLLGVGMGALGAVVAAAWIIGLVKELTAPGYGGQALDIDFAVFGGQRS